MPPRGRQGVGGRAQARVLRLGEIKKKTTAIITGANGGRPGRQEAQMKHNYYQFAGGRGATAADRAATTDTTFIKHRNLSRVRPAPSAPRWDFIQESEAMPLVLVFVSAGMKSGRPLKLPASPILLACAISTTRDAMVDDLQAMLPFRSFYARDPPPTSG